MCSNVYSCMCVSPFGSHACILIQFFLPCIWLRQHYGVNAGRSGFWTVLSHQSVGKDVGESVCVCVQDAESYHTVLCIWLLVLEKLHIGQFSLLLILMPFSLLCRRFAG